MKSLIRTATPDIVNWLFVGIHTDRLFVPMVLYVNVPDDTFIEFQDEY